MAISRKVLVEIKSAKKLTAAAISRLLCILWCSGMNEVFVLLEGYVRVTESGYKTILYVLPRPDPPVIYNIIINMISSLLIIGKYF